MSNQDENSELKSGPYAVLGDIAKILADALKGQPKLAAIVLIVVIVALVTMFIGTKEAVYGFFLLAALGIIVLFRTQVRMQKEQVRTHVGVIVDMNRNTISLVDRLNDAQKQNILKALGGAAKDVADALHIPFNLVRSNLFGVENNDQMRMLQGLTFNMDRKEELTISMPVGYGSTGRCFQSGKPNIAVFREGWGNDVIEDEEHRKVHPDLQWIISIPILAGSEEVRPLWVLNVDGLRERQGEEELRNALSRLFIWSQAISLITTQG